MRPDKQGDRENKKHKKKKKSFTQWTTNNQKNGRGGAADNSVTDNEKSQETTVYRQDQPSDACRLASPGRRPQVTQRGSARAQGLAETKWTVGKIESNNQPSRAASIIRPRRMRARESFEVGQDLVNRPCPRDPKPCNAYLRLSGRDKWSKTA